MQQPENKRWNFFVEHKDTNTGERVVKRFYGPQSAEGYIESLKRVDRCNIKRNFRRRRI